MASSPLLGRLCIVIAAVVTLLFLPLTASASATLFPQPGESFCEFAHETSNDPRPLEEVCGESATPSQPSQPLDCNQLGTCPNPCEAAPSTVSLHDSNDESRILFVDYVYVQSPSPSLQPSPPAPPLVTPSIPSHSGGIWEHTVPEGLSILHIISEAVHGFHGWPKIAPSLPGLPFIILDLDLFRDLRETILNPYSPPGCGVPPEA